MSSAVLLQHIREDLEENKIAFESLCELGAWCLHQGLRDSYGAERSDEAIALRRLLRDHSDYDLRLTALSSRRKAREILLVLRVRRKVDAGVTNEYQRLEGFMWCLEALFDLPMSHFEVDWAQDLCALMVEVEATFLELSDLGIG